VNVELNEKFSERLMPWSKAPSHIAERRQNSSNDDPTCS